MAEPFNAPDPFVLTPGEKTSSTWLRLKDFMETELKIARTKNDDLKLDEIQTAITRGRIQTLKSLIALGDISPIIPIDG